MSALAPVFAEAKAEGRAALIGYLPAGFPTVDGGIAVLQALVESGVDVIEVGFPYSDPLMDGPTIQEAAEIALGQGTRASDVLRTVEGVASTGAPCLVMTYWNPVERYGSRRLRGRPGQGRGLRGHHPRSHPRRGRAVDRRHRCGRHRHRVPGGPVVDACADRPSGRGDHRLHLRRLDHGGHRGPGLGRRRGRGPGGTRAPGDDRPVCVGLGVSTGAQAAEVAAYADGVIVGSAFVRLLLDAESPAAGVAAVARLAAELAEGVRGRL